MSKSFLDSGQFFPPERRNDDDEYDDIPEELRELIEGSQFQYGIGDPPPLDERLIHVSHLATTIFAHRVMPGDGLPISAGASVEAAWDIFNRTKALVDEQEAKDLAEAKTLLEEMEGED